MILTRTSCLTFTHNPTCTGHPTIQHHTLAWSFQLYLDTSPTTDLTKEQNRITSEIRLKLSIIYKNYSDTFYTQIIYYWTGSLFFHNMIIYTRHISIFTASQLQTIQKKLQKCRTRHTDSLLALQALKSQSSNRLDMVCETVLHK